MSHLDRAATLAAIAQLITVDNLPAPLGIQFQDNERGPWAHLTFDSFEAAATWGAHLGATHPSEDIYQPAWHEGPVRSYTAYARPALGLHTVGLSGWTPVDEAPAGDGTR